MSYIQETKYNKRNFHIDTFEVLSTEEAVLQETNTRNGHYTLKVSPFEDTEKINHYGFYYADTLLEPVCKKKNFQPVYNEDITLTQRYPKEEILDIAAYAFQGGRFHRDFHIPSSLANLRYRNWVRDLMEKNLIYALHYKGDLAGFYGYEENKVLLLGIKKEFQQSGLGKLFASYGCQTQFDMGYDELYTSISASNAASLNLFYALGFRLTTALDVYHKLVGPAPEEV